MVPGSTRGHLGSSTKKCAAQNGGPRGGGPPRPFVSLLPPRRHERRLPFHTNEIGARGNSLLSNAHGPLGAAAAISFQPNSKNYSNAKDRGGKSTHGLRRLELPLRMTSTPPRPAAAMTAFWLPKSMPTTDMVAGLCGWCGLTSSAYLSRAKKTEKCERPPTRQATRAIFAACYATRGGSRSTHAACLPHSLIGQPPPLPLPPSIVKYV